MEFLPGFSTKMQENGTRSMTNETMNELLELLTKYINEFFRYLYPGFLIIAVLYFTAPKEISKLIADANAILLTFLVVAAGATAYQAHRVFLEISTTLATWIEIWKYKTTKYSLYEFFDSEFSGRKLTDTGGYCVSKSFFFKYFYYRQAYLYIAGQWFYTDDHKNHWRFMHSRIHAVYLTGEIAVMTGILLMFINGGWKNPLSIVFLIFGLLLWSFAFAEDRYLHRTEYCVALNNKSKIVQMLEQGGFLQKSLSQRETS